MNEMTYTYPEAGRVIDLLKEAGLLEDERLTRHVGAHGRLDFDAVLADPTWSGGEAAVIRIAADVYGGSSRYSDLFRDLGRIHPKLVRTVLDAVGAAAGLETGDTFWESMARGTYGEHW